MPQVREVLVPGQAEDLQPAGDVPPVGVVQQVVDAGMGRVGGTEHRRRLRPPVRPPRLGHVQRRDHPAVRVA